MRKDRVEFSSGQKENFKVAVVSGGFEPERESSEIMGKNIKRALSESGYGRVDEVRADFNIANKLQNTEYDFVFISMFCKWGEDGVIQGLLETLDLPYSGSGVEASSISKNKYVFSRFAAGCGITVPLTSQYSSFDSLSSSKNTLRFPCVIKPVSQGYSLGVSVLEKTSDVDAAALDAFRYSTKVIIQEYIDGNEFTVGILDIPDEGSIVLPIIQLQLKHAIQDVQTKEEEGLATEIVPAPLDKDETSNLGNLALKLYKEIGCLGVSRFDVRQQSDSGVYYFLENNTCPGMVSYEDSDLPKMLDVAGISMEQFVDYMVISGLRRKETKIDTIE